MLEKDEFERFNDNRLIFGLYGRVCIVKIYN